MIANPAWIKAKYECVGSLLAESEQQVRDYMQDYDVTITKVGPEWETKDGRMVRWYDYKAVEK